MYLTLRPLTVSRFMLPLKPARLWSKRMLLRIKKLTHDYKEGKIDKIVILLLFVQISFARARVRMRVYIKD